MTHSPPNHFSLTGRKEPVAFDKITARIIKLCYGLDTNFVDPAQVTQKVTSSTAFSLMKGLEAGLHTYRSRLLPFAFGLIPLLS